MIILGDTVFRDFTTHDPATGNAADADSLPIVEVFEDDNDTAIHMPIVTKRAGKTGNYRCAIVATAENGFEAGKSYNVIATATVNGVTAKSRIESFMLDSIRNSGLEEDIGVLMAFVKNKKYLSKEGNVWYLIIRNTGDDANILKKALKDKSGNDVTDIEAGVLAQELASSV